MRNEQIWRHVQDPPGKRALPSFRTVFAVLVTLLLTAMFLLAVAAIRMSPVTGY